ncbi:hypothetical protein [Propioniciclava tarda]|uniref:Uncharacterized protein n=1 Tax=Propioniciclava tarda TaxID=433330 RepID=A0A4Q9KHK9_PROTD|nr:hypothetical protein [Propioniciclava tarda]TBT91464.1 hypothetical protein ET996_13860 [Propioniciclava tarda]
MGTTDVSLGLVLLDCLDRMNVDYAVLHNTESLASNGAISDIDLAVAGDPWEIVAHLAEQQSAHGLLLAMLWEYDRCSLTSIWLSEAGEDGIQLDFLADPKGRGRYGLRTGVVLAEEVKGRGSTPHLSVSAEAVYTLSKRIAKRDHQRALAAIDVLKAAEGPGAEAVLGKLLSPRMRRRSSRALRTRKIVMCGAGWDLWRPRLSLFGLSRLATGSGAVVSVSGDREKVQAIADRLSLVFPHVEVRSATPSWLLVWWLTRAPRLVIVADCKVGSSPTSLGIGPSIAAQLSARTRVRIANRMRLKGDQ